MEERIELLEQQLKAVTRLNLDYEKSLEHITKQLFYISVDVTSITRGSETTLLLNKDLNFDVKHTLKRHLFESKIISLRIEDIEKCLNKLK